MLSLFSSPGAVLLGLVTVWVLGSGVAQSAPRLEPVEIKLVDEAVVLKGPEGSAVFSVALPPPEARASTPTVTLVWESSQMLDLKTSALTVLVDRKPVASHWLSVVGGRGRLKVSLRGLGAGFHTIEVRARLRIDGDPCLEQFPEGAWLRIEPKSTVVWMPMAADRARADGLADIPAAWRAEEAIELVPLGPVSREMGLALIEADHLVRGWGLASSAASMGGARIALGALNTAGNGAKRGRRWLRKSKRASAVVDFDGETLWIVSRKEKGLPNAVVALGSASFREACRAFPCLIEPLSSTPGSEEMERGTDFPARVWSVGKAGWPRGWVARGSGDHVLRFAWAVPQGVRLAPTPKLKLDVRSAHGLSDRSYLSVQIGGVPLASFSMAEARESHLNVTIPRELWDEPQWDVEVRVFLAPDESAPCDRVDQDSLWVSIGAGSGLWVPRTRERREGLSEFWRSGESRPVLSWPRGTSVEALRVLAAVLYPFARRHPDEAWRFHDGDGPCIERCVVLSLGGQGDVGLEDIEGLALWYGDEQPTGLPFQPAERAPLLVLEQESDGPRRLSVRLAVSRPDATLAWDAPDMSGLPMERALLSAEGWRAFGSRPALLERVDIDMPEEEEKVSGLPGPPNAKAQLLTRVDMVWGVLFMIVLAGFWVWWRRTQSMVTRRTTQSTS